MFITTAIDTFDLKNHEPFANNYKSDPSHANLSINVVMVTGGPCAGKTETLNHLRVEGLVRNGTEFFFASEAAENAIYDNVTFKTCGGDSTFQEEIIETQSLFEQRAVTAAIKYKIAHPKDTVYCVFDRSLLDGEAYFPNPAQYTRLLKKYGFTKPAIYARYDRVIYLQSAANGAEKYYKKTKIRTETLEQAKILDYKVRFAWNEHPKFFKVLNKTEEEKPKKMYASFEEKVADAIGFVIACAGTDYCPAKNKVSVTAYKTRGGANQSDGLVCSCLVDSTSLYLNALSSEGPKYEIRVMESNGVELPLLITSEKNPEPDDGEVYVSSEIALPHPLTVETAVALSKKGKPYTTHTSVVSTTEVLEQVSKSGSNKILVHKKSSYFYEDKFEAVFSELFDKNGYGFLEIYFDNPEDLPEILEKLHAEFEFDDSFHAFWDDSWIPDHLEIQGLGE